MKRRLPSSRSIARRRYQVEPKRRLIVVCEGENTEPKYLTDFSRRHGNQLIVLEVIPKGGAPTSIVDEAVRKHKNQEIAARRSGDSFESAFDVWAVFDQDDHPNIPQALDKAIANKINIALSNPCFELWGLFHFADQDAPIHRHALQKRLMGVMAGYDAKSGKIFDCELLAGRYEEARKRAIASIARRAEEGSPRGNPSTDIYVLLDMIKKHGKG